MNNCANLIDIIILQIARQPDNSRSFDINMYFMHNYHTERAQNVNYYVHSGISGSGLHTVCVPRPFILAAVWGKHGTSSGGRSVFVLDGLARISRRVHPLFVPCSPGGLHPATFQTDSGHHKWHTRMKENKIKRYFQNGFQDGCQCSKNVHNSITRRKVVILNPLSGFRSQWIQF